MKHILLQKALKYKRRRPIQKPKGYIFDVSLGAWVNNIDKSLLIQSTNFPAQGTKKEDIETGEDHKGQ